LAMRLRRRAAVGVVAAAQCGNCAFGDQPSRREASYQEARSATILFCG